MQPRIWFIFLLASTLVVGDELLFLQVIWRHGDRAPTNNYPTDPNGVDSWPYGWGELTEIGMQQQLTLGKLLRTTYINGPTRFLNPRYNPQEIYIRSTDVNRTILSAMSNTAGMYPAGIPGVDFPNNPRGWPSHWTPIPIHAVPENVDHVGNVFAPCSRATELDNLIRSSPQYQAIQQQNKPFFDFLTNMTGTSFNLTNIYDLYDIQYCERLYGLPQPGWMTDLVVDQITKLTQKANEFTFGISRPYVPELSRLRGGPILKHIIDLMNMKVSCLEKENTTDCSWMEKLKYYAYSAHDTTIAAFLSTLGDEEQVIHGTMPLYTASLAIELWRTNSTGYAIRILYHPKFHESYYVVTNMTRGCPNSQYCPLQTFIQRSAKFMPNDILDECKATDQNRTH